MEKKIVNLISSQGPLLILYYFPIIYQKAYKNIEKIRKKNQFPTIFLNNTIIKHFRIPKISTILGSKSP